MKVFKRNKYLKKIISNLKNKEDILFIIGARQVGKTTLLKSLIEYGYIKKTETIFINGDQLFIENIKTYQNFTDYISLRYDIKKIKYLIIDEAQYIQNIGLILKILIDKIRLGEFDFKIIVSGSGSLNIFKGLTDSLIGRKKIIKIYPFDFEEFLETKGINLIKTDSEIVIKEYLKLFFEEYALFGGYPKVVFSTSYEEKIQTIKEIINSYIQQDIKLLLKEKEFLNFPKFFSLIANKISSQINLNQIIEEAGIPRYIAEKYLFVLENSFMINILKPFVSNKFKNEIKKREKIYFSDLGILRFFLGYEKINNFIKGPIIENFIFNEIQKNIDEISEIFFRGNYNENEIDFIIKNSIYNSIKLIETKSGNKDNIPKIILDFCKIFKTENIITTESLYKTRNIENCNINFYPFVIISKCI